MRISYAFRHANCTTGAERTPTDWQARQVREFERGASAEAPAPDPERTKPDAFFEKLHAFRAANVFVGAHNVEDVKRGFERVDFARCKEGRSFIILQ